MKVWGIGRGEFEHCEDEDGNEWLWALCEVASCPNCVCVRMNERFCWPHLMSGGEPDPSIVEEADLRDYEATEPR